MNAILNLLKLQIDNKTDILKAYSPKKMAVSAAKTLALIAALVFAVRMALSRVFMTGIEVTGELLGVVLATTQVISFCFAVGHIISVLYMCRDNEMLICLPVTPNQLFLSKILLIYFKEIVVNAAIIIPILFAMGRFGGVGSSFYLSMPILVLLLPIFPIVLASFVSIPLMAIVRFLRSRPTASIITVLLLVTVLLGAYIFLIGSIGESFNIANQQLETVSRINSAIKNIGGKIIIYYQLACATYDFKLWFYFPIFFVICAVLSVLTVLVIRPFYFKSAMTSLENKTKANAKAGRFKKRKPFWSLVDKEVRCIFRSPTDIFEYFLFTLLMPFIVFSYDKLLMTLSVTQAGVNMIAGAHLMIVAIMAMLSNLVSASAVSREGSNFYISKTIPYSYFSQMFAKMTFNVIFTTLALLVTMAVSTFIYPAWQVILGTVAVIFASIGHIAWSMDMDIKNPKINMQGSEHDSNVSSSTPKSLILGLVIGFLMGLWVIMNSSSGLFGPYVLMIIFAVLFALYRVWMLILRINLCFKKIEM